MVAAVCEYVFGPPGSPDYSLYRVTTARKTAISCVKSRHTYLRKRLDDPDLKDPKPYSLDPRTANSFKKIKLRLIEEEAEREKMSEEEDEQEEQEDEQQEQEDKQQEQVVDVNTGQDAVDLVSEDGETDLVCIV